VKNEIAKAFIHRTCLKADFLNVIARIAENTKKETQG